ncbi:probable beige protein homolog [Cephalotrichum gorgonifer]|uniref:Beige protein homolog 1 n=1 Tax=Cephalotrichum gorgonifer TaxID=2041049 RepID=A0AAE8MUJ4_9PEZI|nr:probable beige protein homolog [Cephalotrichum gorgonifer]
MSTTALRHRSSTSASTPPANTKARQVLNGLLDTLRYKIETRLEEGYPNINGLIESLGLVSRHLSALTSPNPLQDDFRQLCGFDALIQVLRAFSGYYNPIKRSEADMQDLFRLLDVTLECLDLAVRNHPGSRRYFRHRVEEGGWEALEQAIASIGLGDSNASLWSTCRLFGKLLAFAFRDPRLDQLCIAFDRPRQKCTALGTPDTSVGDPGSPSPDNTNANKQDGVLLSISTQVRAVIGSTTKLQNPHILRAVVGFWQSIPRSEGQPPHPCSIILLETLLASVSVSLFNLAAVQSARVFSTLLRTAFDSTVRLGAGEKRLLLKLCKMLMYLGVDQLEDAQFLLRCQTTEASEFCREMVTQYHGPAFFHFDLSLNGHSSIELSTLGRVFPPQTSGGYTFTAWVRVDRFDSSAHTTLFGVFDKSQTCFLLVYIEKDTHNLILQTSVTSQKPSIRFKSVTFKEKHWYHIAIVHRRPKALSTSKASLYINGEFVEQMRCGYPLLPPLSNGSTESFASFTSNSSRPNPVQAFIGTPRDLSTQVGQGLILSKWSLASAHLFEDVLSDDFLAVHFHLGPRYHGNFQDSLGGFQTYEASAALGLRNELFHPGKDEGSDIIKAIREKASSLLPESRIALTILPTAVLSDDCISKDSQLFRALPRAAANSLVHLMRRHGSKIVINAAAVSLTDALLVPQGVAILSGQPVVVAPSYLDDNLWQLAGFTSLALKLLRQATTADETLRSVEVILQCVQNNWRNSEAMERDGGYSVLGMLLRIKLGYAGAGENGVARLQIDGAERDRLTFQLLSLILGFVGYNHAAPVESFIINPLAYRILLIDFDTWRKSAPLTQRLYYQQFVTFAVMSKYHEFNSRRLMRMRIIKRLLDAMKAETISEDVLPSFLEAFENLVKCDFSGEVHRALALFLTYAFHSSSVPRSRTPKPLSATNRTNVPSLNVPRNPTLEVPTVETGSQPSYLTKRQLGKHILAMFSRLLCEKGSVVNIKRFARTVTNKWLLYLLSEDDAEIVTHGSKMVARLLVSHGPGYASKFSGKTGGFIIMADRLKRWWDIPTLWPICFSILFGYDVAEINFDRNFDFFSLIDIFGKSKIAYPDVVPVIGAMIQRAIKDVVHQQVHPDSPHVGGIQSAVETNSKPVGKERRARARSMDLREALDAIASPQNEGERQASRILVLQTVIQFLTDLHATSQGFRDFALMSDYLRLLLSGLYPAIVSTDAVTPRTELESQGSVLNFDGGDVIIRPVGTSAPAPIVRTTGTFNAGVPLPVTSRRGTPLRKASSFILLTSEQQQQQQPQAQLSPTRLAPVLSPRKSKAPSSPQANSAVLEGVLELAINVLLDQVLQRRDFSSFNLFLKIPPGFQEHQAYFESYILRNTISHLANTIQLEMKTVCEPRVLTNMARFTTHVTDAVFEGWFMGGEDSLMEISGMLLEYLQRDEISKLKSVRLCTQAVDTIRRCFLKVILLKLSTIDDPQTSDTEADGHMHKILVWQPALLGCLTGEDDQMRLIWYQLYAKLVDERDSIRLAAASILRIMMVQKPDEASNLLGQFVTPDQQSLTKDFQKLTEVDNEAFVLWVDQHRPSLDALFFGGMSRSWEDWVLIENQKCANSVSVRMAKRKEQLRAWHNQDLANESTIIRHEMGNGSWMKSIFNTEHIKHQRLMQDQQDDMAYTASTYAKMERSLTRPGGIFGEGDTGLKWRLDPTEGRNRMRLRLLPDFSGMHDNYQPKRRGTDQLSSSALRRDSGSNNPTTQNTKSTKSTVPDQVLEIPNSARATPPLITAEPGHVDSNAESEVAPEDDFELVEDPNDPEGDDGFEDRNRKVMRRLQQGDKVQAVYNTSRIIGLEPCDGILIIGKDALYIMDNVFQCATGEIVNAWQAPLDERDPFSQIIMGGKSWSETRQSNARREQESRSWRWQDVISVSKRRFLFRDVAIEVFFTDGRSYLLTTINPPTRDEVFTRLTTKAPHSGRPNMLPNSEDAWRLDSLRVVDEQPQGLGSKFGNLFNSSPLTPVIKKWQRGEISNFHYLMIVNTMAGRTFNDLTQYPVFPWVLADYTSDELDLSNPASFRDLSRPVGLQTPGRIGAFDENYRTLLEMGDTPYHYGTHYSSAMIVASYLIRIPPFVQSYILLQGGNFDHADRIFHSIPGAWKSASCDNKTDVRELTPEFFCFPEFLKNINGYNFGNKESTGEGVDDVTLPPWAKGDPKLFIARNREALESPYVSQNLHRWIDLIFGYKQQGEAAVESMNVFHPLSYRGAKDLDSIEDPQERAIAVETIHNFGQTPHQLFTKPHPAREVVRSPNKRLDVAIMQLTKATNPLIECHERVSTLIYAPKLDRLLCAAPFRLNFAPYDKYLEWGYADNSIRFFFTENRKPAGLFENLHNGQISTAMFVDSKTLILAGEDCVITVFAVITAPGRHVELHPRSPLHGHRTPVTTLAASKSLGILVSVSEGQTLVWDLNRLTLVRKLPFYRPVECAKINDITGEIMLCSGPNVVLYSLNGSLILDQKVCLEAEDYVHSCSFYEGCGSEWVENFLVFTGHGRGIVNVWRRTGRGGRWALELVRRLEGEGSGITCIETRVAGLFTGDEDGRVFEWTIAERER